MVTVTKITPEQVGQSLSVPEPVKSTPVLTNENYSSVVELLTHDAKMLPGYPKSVRCRQFTVSHIKTLVYTNDDSGDYYDICAGVVRNLIDVDPYSLTTLDFEQVILHLRVNSCGAVSNYTVTCDQCKKPSPFAADLTKLAITEADKTFEESIKITDQISLGLPRVKSRTEFGRIQTSNPLDSFALYIQQGDTFEEKLKILDASSPLVIKKISEFVDSIKFGVDNKATFKCRNLIKSTETGVIAQTPCNHEEVLRIPFRSQFFLPE